MKILLKVVWNKRILFFLVLLIIAYIFTNYFDSNLSISLSFVDTIFIVAMLFSLVAIRIKIFNSAIYNDKEIGEIRLLLHQRLSSNTKRLNDFSKKYKQTLIEEEMTVLYSKFKKRKVQIEISYEKFKDIILSNELDQLRSFVKKGKIRPRKFAFKSHLYEKSDLRFKQRVLSGQYAKTQSLIDLIHLITIYGLIASLNLFNDILIDFKINPSVILFFYVFTLVIFLVEGFFSFKKEKTASLKFYRVLRN